MEKEQLKNIEKKELIYNGEGSWIYRLADGRLLKLAKPVVFKTCELVGINYEDKLNNTSAKKVKEIVNPISIVYNERNCLGYTMEEITGATLNEFDKNFSLKQRSDFKSYYELYKKIEEIVKKANQEGIVMPDLCTCDNMIIDQTGNLRFIDFDGMQLGKNDKALSISTSLGNPFDYIQNKKYSDGFFHFTQELDKTSLTKLMFLLIFCIDLNKIGQPNPYANNRLITLKDVFELMGLKDEIFMNKVAKNLSTYEKGEYLEKDLYRIMQNYLMEAYKIPKNYPTAGDYIIRLRHK